MKHIAIVAGVVLFFIVVDILAGVIMALSKQDFTSKKMREGLFHKVGEILCLLLGVMTDFAQRVLDLGIGIPIYEGISGYIIIMEIGSIIETICKINPAIVPDKLLALFRLESKEEDRK